MTATLLGADGQPLRSTRPAGTTAPFGEWFTQSLTDRWTDATDDAAFGFLASFEQLYRSQPVLSSVIDKLARRIATLPFGGFRLIEGGAREAVLNDSLASLIRRPWPRASSVDLNFHIAQSLLIHGNAVLAVVRSSGSRDQAPDMLWPLDWAQIGAYGPQGGLIEWWSTTQFGGQERFIAAVDVLHFAWAAPSGSQIGVSPIEKLGVTLRLDDAVMRHQIAMFRNGSRPSLGVTVEGNAKLDELEFARSRVEAMHKGVDNGGKTFFMGSNVKLQPLSLSPVEAALIDQRRLNREEVGMVYDLAGPLMNDLEHGTYANVAELLKGLYRDVVPPWTELIVQTFQSQLLDVEPAWMDRVLRFEFGDKLKGEPKELADRLRVLVDGGLMTRNEARKELGLPPDGDPSDATNPANQLTANVNNQATIAAMDTGSSAGVDTIQE